jgi:hypothetical protein
MMAEPTREGKDLIKRWRAALQQVERLENQLEDAEDDLERCVIALGQWMSPADARQGEKISVWWGAKLIQVVKHEDTFDITERS